MLRLSRPARSSLLHPQALETFEKMLYQTLSPTKLCSPLPPSEGLLSPMGTPATEKALRIANDGLNVAEALAHDLLPLAVLPRRRDQVQLLVAVPAARPPVRHAKHHRLRLMRHLTALGVARPGWHVEGEAAAHVIAARVAIRFHIKLGADEDETLDRVPAPPNTVHHATVSRVHTCSGECGHCVWRLSTTHRA